jgi:hypothetical protein
VRVEHAYGTVGVGDIRDLLTTEEEGSREVLINPHTTEMAVDQTDSICLSLVEDGAQHHGAWAFAALL